MKRQSQSHETFMSKTDLIDQQVVLRIHVLRATLLKVKNYIVKGEDRETQLDLLKMADDVCKDIMLLPATRK